MRWETIQIQVSKKKFTKYLTKQNKSRNFVKQIGNVRYRSLKD